MIRAREAAPIARIRLDPRTGLPSVEGADPTGGVKSLKPSIDAQRLTLREQVLGADVVSQGTCSHFRLDRYWVFTLLIPCHQNHERPSLVLATSLRKRRRHESRL